MAARRGLCVAALAAAVGVSADTIRHYEWTGLLLAPARTWPRRRLRLPDCGSSEGATLELRDIKGLVAIRDTGVCSGEPAEELCAAD
jgi:hypothetical protein